MKNKIYTLNDKGSKISHGIVDEKILSILDHGKISVHLDIIEIKAIEEIGGISVGKAYILRGLDDTDYILPKEDFEDLVTENLIKLFLEDNGN